MNKKLTELFEEVHTVSEETLNEIKKDKFNRFTEITTGDAGAYLDIDCDLPEDFGDALDFVRNAIESGKSKASFLIVRVTKGD